MSLLVGVALAGPALSLSPLRLPPDLGGHVSSSWTRSAGFWAGLPSSPASLAGERREHLCLLAAGLICGLWWEAWNYSAIAKWVYTLPVLNFGKVFEMPLLGYLGFPPFALECAVMYNFLTALDERVLTTPTRRRYAYGVHLAFWIMMFAAIDAATVISYQ